VIGPWRHSGVNYEARELGQLKLKGDTGLQFRRDYMKPFLDRYLRDGAPQTPTPPVLTYATGADLWQVTQKWPVGTPTPLYLQGSFGLAWTKPDGGYDTYVSDPAKPVPFVPRPIHLRDADVWKPWLVHDQRFAEGRTDVLTYTSAPLDKPVHIMGAAKVDLWAATSGTDSDWVVKLIDVSADGSELPIGIEIFRGRYVRSFEKPEALKPGKAENFRWSLPNVNHVFQPGHRLMVQVQSSLFPLYDRNPQTFVSNIFNAKPGDYKKATQTIYHDPSRPSALWLPVVS
jgi:putative CocE/NonD family hydrolase